MKKFITAALAVFVLAGCSLLSPYSVTFTTPNNSVVDPAVDTLDLAVNLATMAYISEVECLGHDAMELLPVVTDEMTVSKAHNLSLELLSGYAAGTQCEITVTVFDQTTTATTRESINLHVLEMLTPEVEEEAEVTEEEVVEEEAVEETEETDAEYCDDGSVCEAEVTVEETNDETVDEETETGDDSSGEESEA